MLQQSSVAELILFISLHRISSLQSHPTHDPLKINTILILELVNADIERTESPAPSDARAAVDEHRRAVGREVEPREVKLLGLPQLSLADREEKLKDMLATRGDAIVRPSYELVVHDSPLCALSV